MVALMRSSLRDTTRQIQTAHAGLLLTHGLPIWEDKDKDEKSKLIDKITGVSPCKLYELAFSRWLASTSSPEKFSFLTGSLTNRLMMGLSTGGAIETGITTHHTYGMPMIAGSSIKGAVRAYAETIGLDNQYIAVLFGADDELATQANMPESAGYLIWHDAWWVPEGNNKPFVGEVVTVHHQEYYGGNGDATDFDSPIPNQQLAVQGSFYFVVEGETAWVHLAQKLLRDTLQQQGIGSKRAAGYGFFNENQKSEDYVNKQIKIALQSKMTDDEKLKDLIKSLDEQQLAESFGTKRKAFFETNNINSDAEKKAVDIALELHADLIDGWEKETKKTHKAKFKAYKFLMGENDEE